MNEDAGLSGWSEMERRHVVPPARSEPRPTWGIREILLGIAAVLVLLFVVSAVLVLPVAEGFGSESAETRAATGISNGIWNIGMVLAVYALVRRSGGTWRDLGLQVPLPPPLRSDRKRLGPLSLPWPAWCVLGGLLACYGVLYAFSIVISLLGLDWLEPGQQIADEYFDSPWLIAAIGIPVVITAPIAEEVFFRGFIFGGLGRYVPFLAAALVSGIIFAVPHADIGLMIPFSLIGAILANTYRSSGSLMTSIVVHFVFNSLSFLALVFFPEAR